MFFLGTADVKAYVQKNVDWQLVNLTSGKPIGENWVERTHVLRGCPETSKRL
ncbi:hypothetical protein [Wolbachia endosymbiont (group A) of Ophion ellenae]|uniref:hypothetical protein n=1 Tax=Wolbachia endosymbiont (group A) of Ophion ellenae TaxID=3066210 RepID=UPI0030D0D84A